MLRSRFLTVVVLVLVAIAISLGAVAQDDALVIWADGTRAPAITELAAQFTEEFGVPVVVQELAFGDIRDQLSVAGPAGEGPDLFVGPHDHIGQHINNGAIAPINLGDRAAEFTESSLAAFTYNGQLWGVPYGQENVALIRNVDLVPEAPATWEEVAALAEQFAADGTADYAFLARSGDTYHIFPIISAFGGYIFGLNEDGTYNVSDVGLASEGGLAAATWLSDLYNAGLMVPNVDDDVAFELFTAGELGMFVTGPWFSQRIIDTGINYSIDPLPGSAAGLEVGAPFSGVQGFMMSAYSDKQLEAETFLLDFVATSEFMQALFDADPRPPAYLAVDTSANPNISGFLAAGLTAVPMPAIPEMGAVWSAAGNALTALSIGAEPVPTMEEAVGQIANAIRLVQATERIVVLPGAFQSELGCSGDWMPDCLETQLVDQGDGTFAASFEIPAGTYEYKVAMNGGWDENYGVDGVAGGDNLVLELASDSTVTFVYDDTTNVVTATVE